MITTIDRVCQQCHREFNTFPSKLSSGRGKFCSAHCYHTWRKGRDFSTTEVRSQAAKQCWANPIYREHKAPSQKRALEKLQLGAKEFLSKPEHRANISERTKRMWQNPKFHSKVSQNMAVAHLNFFRDHPEERIKVSQRMKQMWNTKFKDRKVPLIQRICEFCNTPFLVRHTAIERGYGRFCSLECSGKAKWQNPEFVAKVFAGLNKKPNKPEKKLIDIFSRQLPQFKYNGDFSLGITLGSLIPDFVNVNGEKQVIEVLGDYFHSPELLGDRWQGSELGKVMLYNSVGYRCLILWESELNKLSEEEIVEKITSFFRAKGGKTWSSLKSKAMVPRESR